MQGSYSFVKTSSKNIFPWISIYMITSDFLFDMYQTTLDDIIVKTIRERVKSGRTKIEVANELDISYYIVKKYTKDIPTILRISMELEQQIRNEVKKGNSIRQIAQELNVSRDSIIKYSRDIPKKLVIERKRSPELIRQIRANVRKYNNKTETARKMDLSSKTVRYYTEDIITIRGISKETKDKIQIKVKQGKTKTQVAREMNLPISIISNNTQDIYKIPKKPDINYRAFLLLEELINNGYAFSSLKWGLKDYQVLKKKFPLIHRFKMYGRVIFYLEDKSDIAVRAFLESLDKRITNYYELKQVINSFKTNIDSEEKKMYIHKKKSKKGGFGKNFEATHLRENDGSFVKNKLFHLLETKRNLHY